jgi:hypothetical protein
MSAPHMIPELDDILDRITLEEAEPTYEALTRWCERFPQHRDALADYFATWAEQEMLPLDTTIDADRFASRAVSHALNLLYEEKRAAEVDTASETLSAAAKKRGFDDPTLARCAGMDESMILKLSKRRLPIETIPRLCFQRLGELLGLPISQIVARLRGPPLAMSVGARLKSKQKAVKRVESFSEALEASSLNEAEKAVWRAALADHVRRSDP